MSKAETVSQQEARETEVDLPSPEPPSPPGVSNLTMKLVIQPPKRVIAGAKLQDPLVITFGVGGVEKPVPDLSFISDITEAFVWISLLSGDGQLLTPPQPTLLKGTYFDSIHRIEKPVGGDTQVVAYASFSDLAISEPGRYCFGVNIIDMEGYV